MVAQIWMLRKTWNLLHLAQEVLVVVPVEARAVVVKGVPAIFVVVKITLVAALVVVNSSSRRKRIDINSSSGERTITVAVAAQDRRYGTKCKMK